MKVTRERRGMSRVFFSKSAALMRRGGLALAAVFGALALAGCGEGGSNGAADESVGKVRSGGVFSEGTIEQKDGFFYRVRADYRVKETEEIVEFDFVVACGATVTLWRYTDPSVRVGLFPAVMVKPTSNGGAILVRAFPILCSTKSLHWGPGGVHGVPPDIMPFVMWFDDVRDLSFGWGYATEDAYSNGASKLDFLGAAILEADRVDWQRWRDKAIAEYKQVGQLPGPLGYNYNGTEEHREFVKSLNPRGQSIARTCKGYIRYPAPKDVIEEIWTAAIEKGYRPRKGQRYLAIDREYIAVNEILRAAGPVFDGHEYRDYHGSPNLQALGAINNSNGGIIRTSDSKNRVIADHYPLLPRSKSTVEPITEPADTYPRRMLVGDDRKGMIACGGDRDGASLDQPFAVVLDSQDLFDVNWKSKTFPLYINDETVVSDMWSDANIGMSPPLFIIDREGFVFEPKFWGSNGP